MHDGADELGDDLLGHFTNHLGFGRLVGRLQRAPALGRDRDDVSVVQAQRAHRHLGGRRNQRAVDRVGAGGVVRDTQNAHLRAPVLPQLGGGRVVSVQRSGDERLCGLVDRERRIDDGKPGLEQEGGHLTRRDFATSLFLDKHHRTRQITLERDSLCRGGVRHGKQRTSERRKPCAGADNPCSHHAPPARSRSRALCASR